MKFTSKISLMVIVLSLLINLFPQPTKAAGEMWVDTVTALDYQLESIYVTDIKMTPYPGISVYVNAIIYYKDASGVDKVLSMPIAKSNWLYGTSVLLNGNFVTVEKLMDIKNKKVNQLTATRYDRNYTPFGIYYSTSVGQWVIKAEYSTNTTKTTTTTITKIQLSVAQGFVQSVSATEIIVGKEGTNSTLKVTSQSKITLNGNAVSIDSIAVGDIVEKAECDQATNTLVNLVAKR